MAMLSIETHIMIDKHKVRQCKKCEEVVFPMPDGETAKFCEECGVAI